MHLFGMLGLTGVSIGGLILFYLLLYKLTGHDLVVEHGPLLIAGALRFLCGVMMFTTGLLGEILVRTYFESQCRRIYAVREIRTKRETPAADSKR